MKIDKNLQAKMANAYHQIKVNNPKTSQTKQADTDRVEISQTAKDMQKLVEQAEKISDVRQEKVLELKKSLEERTYKVPLDKLADSMLREIAAKRKGDS